MEVQNIGSNIIDDSLFFQEAQVDVLHEKIHKYETYPRDELSQTIEAANLINVETLSPVALEKFQNLCGHLHKINTKMMVDAILDKAQNLKEYRVRNPQDIEFLRKAIGEVWQNHSLSEDDSNLLRVASITLAELSSGKKTDMAYPSHVQFNEQAQVSPESAAKGTKLSADWEEGELAFKLLDIAQLFYQGKIEEGLEMANTLPYEIKLPPISEKSGPDEIATFIQETIVKSFEIGRKDGYVPSSQEILELLEEASTLS
ncbi:MAG: hypothetical protein P0S93_04545 [Candidatus Neptunochlamydia sp.]|nr:hypothetical protein [Candidatus Neptunochlamydia sp.]